jgi:predicted AAA+ superfamily ATPase
VVTRLWSWKKEDKIGLLKSYFESVVIRDLSLVRQAIAKLFASFIVSNYSNLVNINKTYNYLRGLGVKVGKETVIELFAKANETYFAFLVEEFEKSESKRKANPKKVYITDTGYPTALGLEFSISRAMFSCKLTCITLIQIFIRIKSSIQQ